MSGMPTQNQLAQLLYLHQQESTSSCGLEDSCECGHPLNGEHIADHQAEIVITELAKIGELKGNFSPCDRVRSKYGDAIGTVEAVPKRLASYLETTGRNHAYVRWDSGWCCLIDPGELERAE